MATPAAVFEDARSNFTVILLLMFMVAGIYFMRELLLLLFTRLLVAARSKILLSLTFAASAAVLSAFLHALTVAAVVISVDHPRLAAPRSTGAGAGRSRPGP